MSEAAALIAARSYGIVPLPLAGDVPPAEVIAALLGVSIALLTEHYDDRGEWFLTAYGTMAVTGITPEDEDEDGESP